MRRRHLRAIQRIQADDPHGGWSVGLWLAELRRETGRAYAVAQVGRQVVGYGGLLIQHDDAHVTTLGVAGTHRGLGVGSRLLAALVRRGLAEGAHNLTLEVRATNEPAIQLYRRFGLAPAGVRKNYYQDLGEDALIMWAHDIDTDAYRARLDALDDELERRAAAAGTTVITEGFDT
jgi:ribosomal-protein-alanine N-acetyltransferase